MSDNKFTLANFRDLVEDKWPQSTAEGWDRVGLVAGRNSKEIKKIYLAVDAVRQTVDEAIAWGADLIFTHHPLLLRGIYTLDEETYKGSLLADLVRADCALLAAHTNADVPIGGVSDVLAKSLGLKNSKAIAENPERADIGIGRVGDLEREISLRELAERLVDILPKTAVGARVAGDSNRKVKRVALLGGSGDSLLNHPRVLEADVYITSDLRHHPAQEALEQYALTGGPALIDVPHFASESLWLGEASEFFKKQIAGVTTKISDLNTDPWQFRVG